MADDTTDQERPTALDAGDWEEVKRLFAELAELAPSQRPGRLASARPPVRAEVESLLAAHQRAEGFLTSGPAGLAPREDALVGQRLGPYEVTGVLGRGGMGVVYRARRSSPALEVAIKIVRPGSESAEATRRIRAEAEMLARLSHPRLARLLDAGFTPQGPPYVVMELVEGQPLERHCATRRPDLRQRLALFLDLCDAVAYAHRQLVVHRDLKPGNVLVTPSGEPRLLDFGIGKLLDQDPAEARTRTGLHLMTPEYASPEQVRGEPVSVATDVHALGLLLHFLLSGRPAFRLRTGSAEELVRVICVDEPPVPSRAVLDGEAPRAFEPPETRQRLAGLLRGDLDAIVAQALRKEPERRYASVEQLADDVRRHLAGRVVRAQKDTFAYRTGKFLRRNRLGVAAGAAVGLSLAAGMAATVWQARVARAERARAERRFTDVRRLANTMLFEVHDQIRDLAGSTEARRLLVTQALGYLDGLAAEAEGDAGLQRELAVAYRKVGDVQGQPGAANLGDRAGALASYRKSLALYRTLATLAPRDVALAEERAAGHVKLAAVQEDAGDLEGAAATAAAGVALSREAAALAPDRPALACQVVAGTVLLSRIHRTQGDSEAAVAVLKGALAEAEAAQSAHPGQAELEDALIDARTNLAELLRQTRDHEAALQLYRRLQSTHRARSQAEPLNARHRRGLVRALLGAGRVLGGLDRWPEAQAEASAAQAVAAADLAADPSNADATRQLVNVEQLLCRATARATRALSPACRSALERAESLAAAQTGAHGAAQYNVVYAWHSLAYALKDTGDWLAAQREPSSASWPWPRP